MEISIFAKERKTKEGRSFTVYLSSLKKKNGEQVPCSVKFNQSCTAPDPAKCPMNIILRQMIWALLNVGKDVVYVDTDSIKCRGDHAAEFEAASNEIRTGANVAIKNEAYTLGITAEYWDIIKKVLDNIADVEYN